MYSKEDISVTTKSFSLLFIIICITLCSILIIACKKDNNPLNDKITYEVTFQNSSSCDIYYLNEKAETINLETKNNPWKYSFKNSYGLKALMLGAKPISLRNDADASFSIYKNGKLKAKGTYKLNSYLLIDYDE